jgi:hypothetical protein
MPAKVLLVSLGLRETARLRVIAVLSSITCAGAVISFRCSGMTGDPAICFATCFCSRSNAGALEFAVAAYPAHLRTLDARLLSARDLELRSILVKRTLL